MYVIFNCIIILVKPQHMVMVVVVCVCVCVSVCVCLLLCCGEQLGVVVVVLGSQS